MPAGERLCWKSGKIMHRTRSDATYHLNRLLNGNRQARGRRVKGINRDANPLVVHVCAYCGAYHIGHLLRRTTKSGKIA